MNLKKKALVLLSILIILLCSHVCYAVENSEESIKKALNAYFDMRYQMLSTLSYGEEIKGFLSADMVNSKDAVNEADVLETIIMYRKMQMNDLRFTKYSKELTYESLQVAQENADVLLNEHLDFYFHCAPTVKNSMDIEHHIRLKKSGDRWFLISDDYQDPDGIKALLSSKFVSKSSSLEEVKQAVLTEMESHTSGGLKKLEDYLDTVKDKNLMVFFIGKTIAYAKGSFSRIDDEKNIAPLVVNGRTLLPLRFIGEKMGGDVVWDQTSKTVELKTDVAGIKIRVGDKFMEVEGKKVALDVPAQITEGRMMLPMRAIAETLGKNIFYDKSGLIVIGDNEMEKQMEKIFTETLVGYFESIFTKSEFPKIDGSTATYPLSIEMGKELLGLDETGAKGFITHNTTHKAYVNLIEKKADIIFVTQPSPEEIELAKKNNVELEVIPVCKEGFVFLANDKNQVNNLTSQQVKDIYQGKIKNWKEVGGDDFEIIPYQREANSGSQTIMEATVMKGLKMMQPPVDTVVFGMGELIDKVADYSNAKNALGYSVYYFASTMYKNRDVKMLSIDGVQPGKETIKDGTYPFTVSYYAVLRKDMPQDSSARKLLKWLLGVDGQKIVDRLGLAPVK